MRRFREEVMEQTEGEILRRLKRENYQKIKRESISEIEEEVEERVKSQYIGIIRELEQKNREFQHNIAEVREEYQ